MTRPRLNGLVIGISGALPEPEVLREQGCSPLEVHLVVRRLAERIFMEGWRVAHLAHPTFTPIIEDCALRFLEGGGGKPVEIYLVQPFFDPQSIAGFAMRHERYAAVSWLGDPGGDRIVALRLARECLLDRSRALICIGGKRHPVAGGKPGVVEEVEIAMERFRGRIPAPGVPVPVYLMSSFGGATRELYLSEPFGISFHSAVNDRLANESDPWAAVDLVLSDLGRLGPVGP